MTKQTPAPDWRSKLVLTVDELAAILGVHSGTIRAAISAGTIGHIRVGRRILVPTAAILATFSPHAHTAGQADV